MQKSRTLFSVVLVIFITGEMLYPQTRRDARAMGLAGAYGAVARGIFAVDYNPANLAIEGNYRSYRIWAGLNTSFSNNFLSLKTYHTYNGQDLEANDGRLKRRLFSDLPDDGWRIFSDVHWALPYINFSRANKAFSSDLIIIGDIGLPRGLIRFLLDGNPLGRELDMTFREELLIMNQWGYSFAVPLENAFIGFTFKYLQGIGYVGLNPDSTYGYINTYFRPGKNYITGEGYYLLQQSMGGRGFAMDIGITSREISGYRLSASLTNLFGRIFWNKSTLLSRLIGGNGFFWDGQYYHYQFQVKQARLDKLFGKAGYGDLFPGHGETFVDSSEFVMRYPSLARFGLSKWVESGIRLSTDFVVGFEDRLYSFGAWKWAVGLEFMRAEHVPFRFGLSFGGMDHQELAFGSGYHRGFFHLDWALGFNHGLWFTSAKGLDFSVMIYTTGRRRDIQK